MGTMTRPWSAFIKSKGGAVAYQKAHVAQHVIGMLGRSADSEFDLGTESLSAPPFPYPLDGTTTWMARQF